MKMLHIGSSGTKDITELITRVTWSGDYQQASRRLEFGVVVSYTDFYLPKISIMPGDVIQFYDRETLVFKGHVFTKQKSHKSNEMNVICYDKGIYLLKNEAAYNFKGMTAEAITKKVCGDFGIAVGELATTGIVQSFISTGDSLYDIIMKAYSKAAQQNGKAYIAIMQHDKFSVIERGTLTTSFELRNDTNIENSNYTIIEDSNYSESIENMINSVQIIDEVGKTAGSGTVTFNE